jgi:hypothetical protein
MKERLNLTIDADLVESMKAYAASKQMSVSELVESYFRTVTRSIPRTNILDMVDELQKPSFDVHINLKEQFYKEASHGL